jgi:hypothetical protein
VEERELRRSTQAEHGKAMIEEAEGEHAAGVAGHTHRGARSGIPTVRIPVRSGSIPVGYRWVA